MDETLKELNLEFNTNLFNELDLKPIKLAPPYRGYSIGKSEQPKYGIGFVYDRFSGQLTSLFILVYEPGRDLWWRSGDRMDLCPEIKGLATSYHDNITIWPKEQLLDTLIRIKKLKP